MPTNIKEMFKWCRYYYKTSSLISPVVYKMAEYPITDLVFEPQNKDLESNNAENLERVLREDVDIKSMLILIGLDYFTYGNAFVTIYFPFTRFLRCGACHNEHLFEDFKSFAEKGSDLDLKNYELVGTCPSCKKTGMKFIINDVPVKQMKRVRIVRLNPENIDIEHNSITGNSEYYYNIPNTDKKAIASKNLEHIKTTPWVFIKALKEQKKVCLNKSNLFHFKRADISDGEDGWGMPLILPVMKDLFYANVLRKAQETIAMEHLVPLRVLFPADNQSNAAPHINTGLGQWKSRVEREIKIWKRDPNYIPVMPIPLGHQKIGGDGKMLLLTQEIRQIQENIIVGMTVPQEFVFGGLSWSGSSVSLRMLENHFLVYRQEILKFFDFLSKKLALFLDTKPLKIKMQEFKMADDIQRKQMFITLNQMAKISDATLLREIAGIDSKAEAAQITRDLNGRIEADRAIATQRGLIDAVTQSLMIQEQAGAQVKAMRIQQRGEKVSPPGNSTGHWWELAQAVQTEQEGQDAFDDQQQGGVAMDPQALAAKYAEQLMQMSPEEQSHYFQQLQQQMPEVAQLVQQMMQQPQPQPQQPEPQPLPEQRPPRRDPSQGVM